MHIILTTPRVADMPKIHIKRLTFHDQARGTSCVGGFWIQQVFPNDKPHIYTFKFQQDR